MIDRNDLKQLDELRDAETPEQLAQSILAGIRAVFTGDDARRCLEETISARETANPSDPVIPHLKSRAAALIHARRMDDVRSERRMELTDEERAHRDFDVFLDMMSISAEDVAWHNARIAAALALPEPERDAFITASPQDYQAQHGRGIPRAMMPLLTLTMQRINEQKSNPTTKEVP